jgi:hypothetical protein
MKGSVSVVYSLMRPLWKRSVSVVYSLTGSLWKGFVSAPQEGLRTILGTRTWCGAGYECLELPHLSSLSSVKIHYILTLKMEGCDWISKERWHLPRALKFWFFELFELFFMEFPLTKITQSSIILTLRFRNYEIISIKLGFANNIKNGCPNFSFYWIFREEIVRIFNNSYIIGLHVRKPHLPLKGFPMLQ